MLDSNAIADDKKHSKICLNHGEMLITNQLSYKDIVKYIGFYTRNGVGATFFVPKIWLKNNFKFYLIVK